MEVGEGRIYQRLETLEGQMREHAVLIREVQRRIDGLEAIAKELGRMEAITSEVQRRVERLERLPEDVSEIKQDLREIKSKIDTQGQGFSTVQTLLWSVLMLVLGYLLNTLPRLFLKGS